MDLMVIAAVNFAIGWIAWIIIGGIAGALAGMVMKGGGFGILGDIIVGIVGAIIGGLILGLFVNMTVGWWGTFITAFIGACILIAILRAIAPKRSRTV
ncbi:MAG TPA: GlsB/YeaQ/YmgE family stress response membrane protein [Chloroflexota bacterium]|nr:GlsB/YeaQ/YmgE family stress response membrane protein [Chloroflexota bacterium]